MTNGTSNDFETYFCQLIIDYYTLYPNTPNIKYEFIFTNNICKKHLELRPDLKDELIKEGIEEDNGVNGRTVLPKYVGDTISILINRQNVIEYTTDKSYTWIGTIAHELTHAIDYSMMALKENLTTYDPLLRRENYLLFQLWSEYHAKRLGYNFLRHELKVDSDITTTVEDRIDNILKKEIPLHMERFYNDYHSGIDGNKQLYLTMHVAGRFSVWCDLFPDFFNDKFLKEKFRECTWLYDVLIFFRKYETLDDIYPYFNDMRSILKENWSWL